MQAAGQAWSVGMSRSIIPPELVCKARCRRKRENTRLDYRQVFPAETLSISCFLDEQGGEQGEKARVVQCSKASGSVVFIAHWSEENAVKSGRVRSEGGWEGID